MNCPVCGEALICRACGAEVVADGVAKPAAQVTELRALLADLGKEVYELRAEVAKLREGKSDGQDEDDW